MYNSTWQKSSPAGLSIGIFGGGQLGKMMARAAIDMGYHPVIYDPNPEAPATCIAENIAAEWDDTEALKAFADRCDRIGFEFENIPQHSLEVVAGITTIFPHPDVLNICRHRGREKQFLAKHDYQTADFRRACTWAEVLEAHDQLSDDVIIKSCEGGYDGKGQIRVEGSSMLCSLKPAISDLLQSGEVTVESKQEFSAECSQIVARNANGTQCALPLTYTEHKNGILRRTVAPLNVDRALAKQAKDIANGIAHDLSLIGVLAVEMFCMPDGSLRVNELAPRPHNSGHWSMDAGCASQFELWVRSLCNLPFGSTEPSHAVEMINLIGDDFHHWHKWLDGDACLHLYGKKDVRVGRKMGHVNLVKDYKAFDFPPA